MNPRRTGKLVQLLRSPADSWLAVRMMAWAIALPTLKHTVALPRLARFMWRDSAGSVAANEIDRVVRLSALAARLRPLPRGDNCLERSLITYRYLSALNANPHLVVAVRTGDRQANGHVWVTVGDRLVAGEDVSMFTPVLEIGARGALISTS